MAFRGLHALLRTGLLLFALFAGPGCLGFVHPIHQPAAELVDPCHTLPHCCRDHVYVFIIHGLDPVDLANLSGVNEYLHDLGFNKTYYGQLYHVWSFDKELHRIHHEDPDARFVLVGFSFGANMVRNLARSAKEEDIPIDLLVYLGGNTLKNIPRDRPENALRIVNILATGWIWNGDTLDGADNTDVPDVYHFGSPTHRYTLEMLARELAVVAGSVPVVQPAEMPAARETGLTPKPVSARKPEPRDEWDFLKPVDRLSFPTVNLPANDASAKEKTVKGKPGTVILTGGSSRPTAAFQPQ
jgi:hypothetical protein